ncbi:MarR family transcriptional regulator [bacterium]|nr:MarR family transcriptional regulator [bacterium]
MDINNNNNKDLSEEILITLRKIARAMSIYSKSLDKHYGLTSPQLLILHELFQTDQIAIGEIARKISLSQATVTDIIDRLETKGLVLRTKNSLDRRQVLIKISPNGKNIVNKKPSLLQEEFLIEFNKLQKWEQHLLLSSVEKIASMMKTKSYLKNSVKTSLKNINFKKEKPSL